MITKIEITSLKELFAIKNLLGSDFIYRGHADDDWPLSSTLERIVENKTNKLILAKELATISSFKYRAKNYLSHIPDDYDFFEWMTLIQHHGGATRMLDFTISFYIALFFAIEDFNGSIEESEKFHPCIWCINYDNLRTGLPEKLKIDIDKKQRMFSFEYAEKTLFNAYMLEQGKRDALSNLPLCKSQIESIDEEYLYDNKYSYILPIVPNNQFPRLAAQRGLFLVPLDITNSFKSCLFNNFNMNDDHETIVATEYALQNPDVIHHTNIIKITFINDKDLFLDILRNLKDMNLTAEYLYPGLDGLAKSSRFTYIINQ